MVPGRALRRLLGASAAPAASATSETAAADGSSPPVALTSDAAIDWDPVWSPDGRSLYFASERGGAMNVWRVGIDARTGGVRGEPEPVTTPSRVAGSISLSRDGRQMLYVSAEKRSVIQRLGLDPARGTVREPARPALQASRVIYTQDLSPDGQVDRFHQPGRAGGPLRRRRRAAAATVQLTDDAVSGTAGPAGRPTAAASPSTATARAGTRCG